MACFHPWSYLLAMGLALQGCDQSPAFQEKKKGIENPKDIPLETDPNQNDRLEYRFPSHEVLTKKTSFSLNRDQLKTQLKLTHEKSIQKLSTTQIERPIGRDEFTQGHLGEDHTDDFLQVSEKPLDLLIVMDNSRSMLEEQQNLSEKFDPLLTFLAGTDWRIGVVTTTPWEGCLRTLITKDDANPREAFKKAILAGLSGSGVEQGVLQAVRALKGECLQEPWVRRTSTLALLFVSDEDNCSDGTQCDSADQSADYLLNYLKSIRELGVSVKSYGLIWHPDESSEECATGNEQAHIYAEIIAATNGAYGSVCAADYSDTLKKISANIASVLKTSFPLTYEPSKGPMTVTIDGVEVKEGYQVEGKRLIFDKAPENGAKVTITYLHSGTPMVKEFSLSKRPDPTTLEVWVNGDKKAGQEFSYSKNQIIFKTPPEAGAQILVRYRRFRALNSYFEFDQTLQEETLLVYADDTAVDFEVIRKDPLKLKITPPPRDGANLDVVLEKELGPRLRYPLNVPQHVVQVAVTRSASAAPVDFEIKDGDLVIPEHEFKKGEVLEIAFQITNPLTLIPLSTNRGQSIAIYDSSSQLVCQGVFSLAKKGVDVASCDFKAEESYQFSYEVKGEAILSHSLSLPEDYLDYHFKLWANKQEIEDFEMTENTLLLKSPPPEEGELILLGTKGEAKL